MLPWGARSPREGKPRYSVSSGCAFEANRYAASRSEPKTSTTAAHTHGTAVAVPLDAANQSETDASANKSAVRGPILGHPGTRLVSALMPVIHPVITNKLASNVATLAARANLLVPLDGLAVSIADPPQSSYNRGETRPRATTYSYGRAPARSSIFAAQHPSLRFARVRRVKPPRPGPPSLHRLPSSYPWRSAARAGG